MEINLAQLKQHKQLKNNSCVPMSVECVLKLLGLMPGSNFDLQEDETKIGNSNWCYPSFEYPLQDSKVSFKREFLLSDINQDDRGQHFIDNYFDDLFNTIDTELQNSRFVIISVQSAPTPTQWHNEIIYDKVCDGIYKTITFYHGETAHKLWPNQDLKNRVREMKGTDIITYKLIS